MADGALLTGYPRYTSSYSNSFEDQIPVDFTYMGPIFKWVTETLLRARVINHIPNNGLAPPQANISINHTTFCIFPGLYYCFNIIIVILSIFLSSLVANIASSHTPGCKRKPVPKIVRVVRTVGAFIRWSIYREGHRKLPGILSYELFTIQFQIKLKVLVIIVQKSGIIISELNPMSNRFSIMRCIYKPRWSTTQKYV